MSGEQPDAEPPAENSERPPLGPTLAADSSYGSASRKPVLRRESAIAVRDFWRSADLERKQKDLETQCLEVADQQELSTKERKKLAEVTKNFKKLGEEEKKTQHGALLKAYQEEVDRLTRRAKSGENYFLNLYKVLYHAPDPAPVLTDLVEDLDRLLAGQSGNAKMQQELEEYRSEIGNLKNQEVTIKKLERRIGNFELETKDKVDAAVEEAKKTWQEEMNKELQARDEREEELLKIMKQVKESSSLEKRSTNELQSELLDLRGKYEEEVHAKQQQIDMLSEEVERQTSRVGSMEREKDEINKQYLALWQTKGATAVAGQVAQEHARAADVAADDERRAAVAKVKELLEQVLRLETSASLAKQAQDADAQMWQQALADRDEQLFALRRELDTRPAADEFAKLKHDLRLMQAVEYGTKLEEDGDGTAAEHSFETILLQKNRHIEAKLTDTRLALEHKTAECGSLHERISELDAETGGLRTLVSQLEQDVLLGSSQPTAPQSQPTTVKGSFQITVGDVGLERAAALTQSSPIAPDGTVHDSSVLSVVSGQRDRFRTKVQQLEEENSQLKASVNIQAIEVQTLKDDNVKLYEKIKYLRTFGQSGLQTDGVETKYKKEYEDGINPFTAFQKNASRKAVAELPAAERVVLGFMRFIVSNPNARKMALVYILLLHFLMFITMFTYTSTKPSRCIT